MKRVERTSNRENDASRRRWPAGHVASGVAVSMLFAISGTGCIAANDMAGKSAPSRSEEIDDLDRARSAGAIDEADYLELRRSFILAD